MGNSATSPNRFDWQSVIQEATAEVDPEKLRAKISEAESAIFQRLQTLSKDPASEVERLALKDASNTLLVLKREILKFPDWQV